MDKLIENFLNNLKIHAIVKENSNAYKVLVNAGWQVVCVIDGYAYISDCWRYAIVDIK